MLFKRILLGLFLAFILIQFIPSNTENPEITHPIQLPDSVHTLIKNACYDCHSNETKWPWYKNVAPVSWIMIDHVDHGRKHLNFSAWESYELKRKLHKLEEIREEIEKNKMPLTDYKMMHPESEWTDEEKQKVVQWSSQYERLLRKTSNDSLQQ